MTSHVLLDFDSWISKLKLSLTLMIGFVLIWYMPYAFLIVLWLCYPIAVFVLSVSVWLQLVLLGQQRVDLWSMTSMQNSIKFKMKCTVYNSDLLYNILTIVPTWVLFHPKCIVDINTINLITLLPWLLSCCALIKWTYATARGCWTECVNRTVKLTMIHV